MHPVARLPEDWKESLAARAERPFRAQQIFRWIHARGVLEPEGMTDISPPLRAWLAEEGLPGGIEVAEIHRSSDQTRKLLLKMQDGAPIETVLIPAEGHESDADAAAADDLEEEGDKPAVRVTQC